MSMHTLLNVFLLILVDIHLKFYEYSHCADGDMRLPMQVRIFPIHKERAGQNGIQCLSLSNPPNEKGCHGHLSLPQARRSTFTGNILMRFPVICRYFIRLLLCNSLSLKDQELLLFSSSLQKTTHFFLSLSSCFFLTSHYLTPLGRSPHRMTQKFSFTRAQLVLELISRADKCISWRI